MSLHVEGRFSEPLQQNRGVKQGDPLSPLLFNCVIDWALDALDLVIGLTIGKSQIKLKLRLCISRNMRWLVVAAVVAVYEEMSGKWLVVAVVVVGCCSILAG